MAAIWVASNDALKPTFWPVSKSKYSVVAVAVVESRNPGCLIKNAGYDDRTMVVAAVRFPFLLSA